MMKPEEAQMMLDQATPTCFICNADVARENMSLETSIVKLKKHPDSVVPEYTHYYMVCPGCKRKGELV